MQTIELMEYVEHQTKFNLELKDISKVRVAELELLRNDIESKPRGRNELARLSGINYLVGLNERLNSIAIDNLYYLKNGRRMS